MSSRIDGVLVTPLARIADERGTILHMLRADDPHFLGFGEIYFSTVYPGAIKGWHIHREMTLNYAIPVGRVKLVLYDDRPGSSTRGVLEEHFVGEENYLLLTVPPVVWNGFKGIGSGTAVSVVANAATLPHDPSEIDGSTPSIRPSRTIEDCATDD